MNSSPECLPLNPSPLTNTLIMKPSSLDFGISVGIYSLNLPSIPEA